MIQDIAPYSYHNEYKKREAELEDTLLCYEGKKIFVKAEQDKISFSHFFRGRELRGSVERKSDISFFH